MHEYEIEFENDRLEIKEWDVLPPTLSEVKSYSIHIHNVNILIPMFDRANLKSLKVLLISNEESALHRICYYGNMHYQTYQTSLSRENDQNLDFGSFFA